jgi:hypothetical protein
MVYAHEGRFAFNIPFFWHFLQVFFNGSKKTVMGISRFSQKTSNSGQKRHFVRFFLQNGQKKSVIWLIFSLTRGVRCITNAAFLTFLLLSRGLNFS